MRRTFHIAACLLAALLALGTSCKRQEHSADGPKNITLTYFINDIMQIGQVEEEMTGMQGLGKPFVL